jgi:hypothetical protein
MTRLGQRQGPRPPIDPLHVFVLMVRHGDRFKVSRHMGFHERGLTTAANRWARRGEYALLFALDAGRYLHESRRAQRIARGGQGR